VTPLETVAIVVLTPFIVVIPFWTVMGQILSADSSDGDQS